MAAACETAIARGMREIAFADHVDFEPLDECCGYLRPAAYLAEIERCRAIYGDQLTIRAGVEIGEAHVYRDQAAALLEAHEFDFVLGSLHWVDGRLHNDKRYFAGRTLDEGLHAYFEELARLASEADYDVLAHLDTVRRAAYRAFGLKALDYAPYKETIRRTLRTLVERGKGLEVNTVTVRLSASRLSGSTERSQSLGKVSTKSHGEACRRGMGDPSPPLQVLRWYRELGGEILTFGSDAHTPDAIGSCFDVALEMVRTAGFTRLATFKQRQIHWVEI
jgi:histidinol-phosphatase (PHP family)